MKILSSSAVRHTAAAMAREENPSRMEAPHLALLVVRRPQINTTGARVRAPSVAAFQPGKRKQKFQQISKARSSYHQRTQRSVTMAMA